MVLTAMRFSISLLLLLGLTTVRSAEIQPRPATPDEVALFKAALKNTQQDTEHWAYTETMQKKIGVSGKLPGETVVRFDPSLPWPDQYTPLKVDGRAPSEKDLKKYRERGEKRGQQITRAAALATDPTTPGQPVAPPKAKKKDVEVKPDTDHPRIASEDGERLTYDVPLISNNKDVPVDKFEILVVVNRTTRQVEHATMRIKESFRMKVVAKVKAGEGSIDFTVVDPNYGPVMTSASGKFGASLLLVPVNATFASTRTDWKRVKPYNERLQVKIGPLELLDF
jgi:hypothetical protein